MLDSQDQLTKTKSTAQAERAEPALPCAIVIFGAAGDLTKRLIVPALYNLTSARQLANGFQLVGVDHAMMASSTLTISIRAHGDGLPNG